MAQSTLLESGQRIPIMYPYGKLANDQQPRFIRAPFVILRLNGIEYLMPEAIGNNLPEMNILAADTVALEQIMSRADFGLEGSEQYMVGEHELGNFNDVTWKGCHRFGII